MQNRILIYYPHVTKSGGHHSFFHDIFTSSLEDQAEIILYTRSDENDRYDDTLGSCIEIAREHDCKTVIVPFLDAYVTELRRNPSMDTSGIQFVCLWIEPLCCKSFQIQELKDKVKAILRLHLLKRSRFLRSSHLLTLDENAIPCMEKHWDNVHWLPDPPAFLNEGRQERAKKYDFLMYGGFTRRKGLHTVIQAVKLLVERGRTCTVKLMGQLSPYPLTSEETVDLNNLMKNGHIEIVDRWIEDEELIEALGESSAVLLPYVNFYASSGILVTACEFGKKIIASDSGTFGTRVKDLDLGLTFSAGDPAALADAMMKSFSMKVPIEAQRTFVEKNAMDEVHKVIRDVTVEAMHEDPAPDPICRVS